MAEGTYRVRKRGAKEYPYLGPRDETKAVFVAAGAIQDGVDFALVRGIRIAGRTVDMHGNPVAGARVDGRGTLGGLFLTESDRNGDFEMFVPRGAQNIVIFADATDMLSLNEGPFTLGDDELENVTVTLYPAGSVAGRLLDSQGRPVSDAGVYVKLKVVELFDRDRSGAKRGGKHGRLSKRDKELGAFKFVNVLSGTYCILYNDPHGHLELVNVTLGHGENISDLDIMLPEGHEPQPRPKPPQKPYMIAGRVTNRAGEPVADASVHAYREGGSNEYVRTDEGGYYELRTSSAGAYRLKVTHDGYTSSVRKAVETGRRGVNFILEGKGVIEGQVVCTDTGAPVAEFEIGHVSAYAGDFAGSFPLLASSLRFSNRIHDSEGRFTIEAEVGKRAVYARAAGFAPAYALVTVLPPEQGPTKIAVRLGRGRAVAGTVRTSKGEAVANATMFVGEKPFYVTEDLKWPWVGTGQSDASGSFRIEGLLPWQWYVSAYHPDYAPASVHVSLENRRESRIELVLSDTGTIEGVVRFNGEPVCGASVSVYYTDHSRWCRETDVGGAFRFVRATPAEVEVRVTTRFPGDDSTRNLTQQAIIAPGTVTVVDFEFPRADSSVQGTVFIGNEPAETVDVHVNVATPSGEERDHERNQASGTYRFARLPAGAATLSVKARTAGKEWFEKTLQFGIEEGEAVVQDVQF